MTKTMSSLITEAVRRLCKTRQPITVGQIDNMARHLLRQDGVASPVPESLWGPLAEAIYGHEDVRIFE